MQIDSCNAKGWGAKKHPYFDLSKSFETCYCDIKAKDTKGGVLGGCGPEQAGIPAPAVYCLIAPSVAGNNIICAHYFGATLQYLPERTEANKDSCFVANCPGGQEPSGFNMNGETECACPAGEIFHDGACAAPSAEVCGDEFSPAKFYDSAAGECVAFAVCQAGATLNRVANVCECAGAAVLDSAGTGCLCESPNVGTPEDCAAPSAEVCGDKFSPAKFYDSAAGECVAFAVCQAGATLNRVANVCECAGAAVLDSAGTGCLCESPNVGTPEDCAAPSAEVCGDKFSPAKFYDSAAGECVAFAVCQAGATLNRVANVCECAGAAVLDSAGTGCLCESPNLGTPGDCAAPSAESCGGLTPPKFYDSAAGECVDVAVCTSPEVRNAGTNRCECSSPNVETDGGNCAVPSAQVCEDEFSPPKFYDAGAGACVDVAACLAPAELDEAANLCNCPSPNVGTDGEVEPGKCAVPVPSAEACGDLIPPQFYSATLSACVPFVECAAPAVLNAGTNLCDCRAPYSGTDGAAAPGDCAAPPDACTIDDFNHAVYDAAGLMQLSLRIDTCNAKGWGAKKAYSFSSFSGICYCDIETIDSAKKHSRCDFLSPEQACQINFPSVRSNLSCGYYFGATLQYLPQRTEENKDSCFVSHCPGGQQPSGFNMNGETECACPAGEIFHDGACVAPSAESCGGLTPPKFYDSAAGECVDLAVCAAPAVRNAGTNLCDCPSPNVGTDGADARGDCVAASVESCGGVTPAQGYDSTAGACVACIAGQSVYNGACVCPVGQVVLNNACAACGDGEIVYRGVCADASVLELSGKALTLYNLLVARVTTSDIDGDPSIYLNALKEYQQAILDRHNGVANYIGNLNDFVTGVRLDRGVYYLFLLDAEAAGFGDDFVRMSTEPGQIDRILSQIPVHTSGSSSAPFGLQACQNAGWIFSADDSSCGVPLTLSGGAVSNKCNLSGSDSPQCSAVFGSTVNYFPSPTLSADGATLRFVYNCDLDDENGLIPATINTIGATECACPAGEALHSKAKRTCVAASAEVCEGLSPAKFYDSGTGECVDAAVCTLPAVLDAGANLCDCPAQYVGTDGAAAPGDCGCPVGQLFKDGACAAPTTPEEQCAAAGWDLFADDGSCGILVELGGGGDSDRCYFSGVQSPQCADVFGATVNYFPAPTLAADGATTLRFVYDCDPNGQTGLVPATVNTIGATACVCSDAKRTFSGGRCACSSGYREVGGQCEPENFCIYEDIAANFPSSDFTDADRTQVSLQIDNCRAKGWEAKKHELFDFVSSLQVCYCDIKAKDVAAGAGGCGAPASGDEPQSRCRFTSDAGVAGCKHYFGDTLQHLPQRTEANKDSCFVSHCSGGQEPSGFSMNGETECACPGEQVFYDGACAAPSAESCGGLTPAKFYDSAAEACVAVADCLAPAVLDAGANLCDCPSPNIGTDGAVAPGDCAVLAPSVESCGGLTPAQFYLATPSACVPFADCQAGATLNRVANVCECAGAAVLDGAGTGCLCESPNVGTPGDCAAPGAEVCVDEFSPAKFYDAGAGECVDVAVCTSPAVLNAGTNRCDCPAPNVGTDGAVAPGDCAAPSVESCGGLDPAKFYDSAAGACVAVADCQAPSVLDAGANLCDCPAPNIGTDGAVAPGDCAAPGVESCGGLIPPQFYSATLSACVPFVECAAPAALNTGTNLCDCPSPNVGTDGAVAPGECVAASVESCGGLSPAKFYDAAAGACVAVADCLAPAVLDAGANLCDCPSPNIGTDGAVAPGDCAVPVPSVESCGGLIPPQFYSATLSACVPFADCQGGATLNAGVNRCDCPAGSVHRSKLCAPVSDDFGELSDELLCGAFGGTVRTATGGEAGGRVCSGMDANDTFCIMDAEEADSVLAFPCRGLFKHLWACNVKFNRPALNPFFCGAKCIREMKAVGSGCR